MPLSNKREMVYKTRHDSHHLPNLNVTYILIYGHTFYASRLVIPLFKSDLANTSSVFTLITNKIFFLTFF
jgi:hypothetical protein